MPDVNDLRPFKASEFKLDGYYYIKQSDGSFLLAITYKVEEWDRWPELYRQTFRSGMKKMSEQNVLFVSINNPWVNPFSIRV